MNDNPDQRLDALFTAARAAAPDTSRLEYGFETRCVARLREERGESLSAWAWRLCPVFAALALAIGWWSHTQGAADADASPFSEFAPGNEEQWLAAYLTGDQP